jgi:pimeloyl-ACP methyl ester carboxylesterase
LEIELVHQHITIGDSSLHIVEAGRQFSESIVFLHGWPEDWMEWRSIINLAAKTYHIIALDLPGVGESSEAVSNGEKAAIAEVVHQVIRTLGLNTYSIVGHDAGAMVSYAYLRRYSAELKAAILISSVIPGVEPWSKVMANPYVWHFRFHAIPNLPETLVMGNQRAYFDYFFNTLIKDPLKISDSTRDHYVSAYRSNKALQTGFEWYRTFQKDAEANSKDTIITNTPLLYLRGEFEGGDIRDYVSGFHEVGITFVTSARIRGSGHFLPEESPEAVWANIERFIKADCKEEEGRAVILPN